MEQFLLGWGNITSLQDGVVMVIMISVTGNSLNFHITMTSRKRDASGKANSESNVSSNQTRQLKGYTVGRWAAWGSSWEASSRLQRPGNASELPDLGVLPGCIWGQKWAVHRSPGLLPLPALWFLLNERTVGARIFQAVTYPGQVS